MRTHETQAQRTNACVIDCKTMALLVEHEVCSNHAHTGEFVREEVLLSAGVDDPSSFRAIFRFFYK